MGTWGAGPFENDDALDFAHSVKTVDDLQHTLDQVADNEEMDADLACRIVVVAECVAAMQGHRHADMPIELANIVSNFGEPSFELYELARNQLTHVLELSELTDLWAEAEPRDRADWNIEMTGLVKRLSLPIKKKRKPRKRKLDPNPSPCLFCGEPMGEEEFSNFLITLEDAYGASQQGGYVHLNCLNAAMHPKYMIQNWEFDDVLLDRLKARLVAHREAN